MPLPWGFQWRFPALSSRSRPGSRARSFAASFAVARFGLGVLRARVSGPRPRVCSCLRVRSLALASSPVAPPRSVGRRVCVLARPARSGSPARWPRSRRRSRSRSACRRVSPPPLRAPSCARLGLSLLVGALVLRSRARFLALWRGFRASPAPLPRRLLALALALLPLPARRPLLRLCAAWPARWPRWLVRLASRLAGYVVVSAGALVALWLLSFGGR